MKLGIQCFGLKDMPKDNMEGFFGDLYSMGYRLVEPFINFGEKPPFDMWSIWQEADAEERMEVFKKVGLEVFSVHILGTPAPVLDKMIAFAEKYGVKQFVVGMPRELTEASCKAAAKEYADCATKLKEHGVALLVHNGGAEPTAVKINGTTAYEFLLDEAGELVGAQPDLGWVAAGGEDITEWVRRNISRLWSIHYKDRRGDEEMPVGKGDLDLFSCVKDACVLGIPHIIDMDTCTKEDIEYAGKVIENFAMRRDWTESVLCIMDTETGEVTELKRFDDVIEAPNWSVDGSCLYYNAGGLIYRYILETGEIEQVDTGMCVKCNNDHVLSADGKRIAVSQGSSSRIYIVDLTGEKEPVLVTENSPSFLHGWSSDGEMTFCAFRGGSRFVDIYTISENGGEEKRITDGIGYNDGPEYSPDNRYIWYNSTRNGLMQIFRMNRDGSDVTQITHTDNNEWFPHISPDCKKIAYLTFKKGDLDPNQHVGNLNVSLSVMDYDGTNARELIRFFGGQGTINVNSWAPDSRRFAFVKYPPKK